MRFEVKSYTCRRTLLYYYYMNFEKFFVKIIFFLILRQILSEKVGSKFFLRRSYFEIKIRENRKNKNVYFSTFSNFYLKKDLWAVFLWFSIAFIPNLKKLRNCFERFIALIINSKITSANAIFDSIFVVFRSFKPLKCPFKP